MAKDPKKGASQNFNAPKRPEDVDHSEQTSEPPETRDSVDALFDALQTAKRKKTFSIQEKLGRLGEKMESESFIPVKRAAAVFFGFVVIVYGTVVLIRFLEKKSLESAAFKAVPSIETPTAQNTPQNTNDHKTTAPAVSASQHPRTTPAAPKHTPPSVTRGKTRPKERDLFEDPVLVDKENEEAPASETAEESEDEPESPTAKEKAEEPSESDSPSDDEKDFEPGEEPPPTPALE